MLQIDLQNGQKREMFRNNSANLQPIGGLKKGGKTQAQPDAQGLNSYNSLNRANRIRGLAKIIDENKNLLDKLQNTKSTFDRSKLKHDFNKQEKYKAMI